MNVIEYIEYIKRKFKICVESKLLKHYLQYILQNNLMIWTNFTVEKYVEKICWEKVQFFTSVLPSFYGVVTLYF